MERGDVGGLVRGTMAIARAIGSMATLVPTARVRAVGGRKWTVKIAAVAGGHRRRLPDASHGGAGPAFANTTGPTPPAVCTCVGGRLRRARFGVVQLYGRIAGASEGERNRRWQGVAMPPVGKRG